MQRFFEIIIVIVLLFIQVGVPHHHDHRHHDHDHDHDHPPHHHHQAKAPTHWTTVLVPLLTTQWPTQLDIIYLLMSINMRYGGDSPWMPLGKQNNDIDGDEW